MARVPGTSRQAADWAKDRRLLPRRLRRGRATLATLKPGTEDHAAVARQLAMLEQDGAQMASGAVATALLELAERKRAA